MREPRNARGRWRRGATAVELVPLAARQKHLQHALLDPDVLAVEPHEVARAVAVGEAEQHVADRVLQPARRRRAMAAGVLRTRKVRRADGKAAA